MTVNYHFRRRNKDFKVRKVRESLPEYFTESYPKLVSFLEEYYNFLDSDGQHGFSENIKKSFTFKDIHETESTNLNNYVSMVGAGLKTGEGFTDSRYALTRLAELLRSKGSKFSIQEFFRLFFQTEAEVEYPKEQIFRVFSPDSDVPLSLIGTESLKVIQNNELFQIFSLLIKVGLDTSRWTELYKKFIHPAGFFFQGQVTLTEEADMGIGAMPLSIPDSAVGPSVISEAALGLNVPFTQFTVLIDSAGREVRSDLSQLISTYQTLSATDINKFYSSVAQIITPNSFTFDDSNIRDSALNATPDFSLSTETMDNEMFTRYTSDSSF